MSPLGRSERCAIGSLDLVAVVGDGLDVAEGSASGRVTDAPVVFAGHGMFGIEPSQLLPLFGCPAALGEAGYDDLEPLGDLTGKVVVMLEGFPRWMDCLAFPNGLLFKCWRGGVADRGAAAVLLAPPHGVNSSELAFGCGDVPTLRISREVLETLVPAVRQQEASILRGVSPSRELEGLRATVEVLGAEEARVAENVLAVIPGTDPVLRDEVVIVGAHLDAWGPVPFRDGYHPGANDNASGLAVILELARAVAESPTRPRRTLMFAAWNAGSRSWSDRTPTPPRRSCRSSAPWPRSRSTWSASDPPGWPSRTSARSLRSSSTWRWGTRSSGSPTGRCSRSRGPSTTTTSRSWSAGSPAPCSSSAGSTTPTTTPSRTSPRTSPARPSRRPRSSSGRR